MNKTLLFLLLIMIVCPLYSHNILETTKVSETALFKRDFPRIDAQNRAYLVFMLLRLTKLKLPCIMWAKLMQWKKMKQDIGME